MPWNRLQASGRWAIVTILAVLAFALLSASPAIGDRGAAPAQFVGHGAERADPRQPGQHPKQGRP